MSRTLGEIRMNITFQDGNNDAKQNVLERSARAINHLEVIRENHPVNDEDKAEFNRAISIAQTDAEQSGLNAVKALSYKKSE